ncbi:MAG: hypothetical protein JSR18_09835 [Proteobacteria bacterium]|nr:hypothetical protein [Pseudomonadota bacterium]
MTMSLMLLAAAMALPGCANDRFSYARQDPFLWFLSGMPAPYDLGWKQEPVPDLPVLNPVDYVPVQPPPPLDYPRGWNPDNPPLMPADVDGAPAPAVPQPTPAPESRCAVSACDPTTAQPATDPVADDGDVLRVVVDVDDAGAGRAGSASGQR